jgi:hypothetical protein
MQGKATTTIQNCVTCGPFDSVNGLPAGAISFPHGTIGGRECAPKTHDEPRKGWYFGTVLVK